MNKVCNVAHDQVTHDNSHYVVQTTATVRWADTDIRLIVKTTVQSVRIDGHWKMKAKLSLEIVSEGEGVIWVLKRL